MTDSIQKACVQAVKLLSIRKAEPPAFCMTTLGIFFFRLEKNIVIHMSSWETPLVGLQAVNRFANAHGSCPDKNGFKKQRSFSYLLSTRLAILASLPVPAPQASLSFQPWLMCLEAWQCCTVAQEGAYPPSATGAPCGHTAQFEQ